MQKDDYYPFGLGIAGLSAKKENSPGNRWTFQGQERQDAHDLGWYGFKWRNHQPELGRFFNIDPLSEKYAFNSTFAFSENRVVDGVELEGLERLGLADKLYHYEHDNYLEFAGKMFCNSIVSSLNGFASGINWALDVIDSRHPINFIGDQFKNVWPAMKQQAVYEWNHPEVFWNSFKNPATWEDAIGGTADMLFGSHGASQFSKTPPLLLRSFQKVDNYLYSSTDDLMRQFLPNQPLASNLDVVQYSAYWAEQVFGGTGPVLGTHKHTFASKFIRMYNKEIFDTGLLVDQYLPNKSIGIGRLDVLDINNLMKYDFKFGNAFMSPSQFGLYNSYFPNFGMGIVRPYMPLQIIK